MLCAFAINDDEADTLFSAPFKNSWIRHCGGILSVYKDWRKMRKFEEKMLCHSYLQTVDFDWRSSKRNNWQKWRTSQSYSTLSVQNGDGNSAVDNYNHVIVTLCAPCFIEMDLNNSS